MRKVLSIFAAVLFVTGIQAQQNAIEKHYSNYLDRDDVTKISVTGKIFQLAAHIEVDEEDKEAQEFMEFVSSIDFFQMIVGDEGNFTKSDYRSALGKVERGYEELMTIEDKEGQFNFRIKEDRGVVKELIMIGIAGDDLIILSLSGRMDLNQIGSMGSQIQTSGFQYLEKLESSDLEEIKVYPNPARTGDDLNIQVPERFVGGDARLMDLNGRLVMTYPMTKKRQMIKLGKVKAGQYVMEFQKDEITVTRKVNVE